MPLVVLVFRREVSNKLHDFNAVVTYPKSVHPDNQDPDNYTNKVTVISNPVPSSLNVGTVVKGVQM